MTVFFYQNSPLFYIILFLCIYIDNINFNERVNLPLAIIFIIFKEIDQDI